MADLNIGNSSANVVVNAKHNGSVIPQINNTYDLGTSALRWKNIYGDLKGNADNATALAGIASNSAVPLTDPGAGKIKYYYNVNNGLTGNMPTSNNANGILYLNTHNGEYGYQLGFSSNGNIYYRNKNGSAFTESAAWKTILDSSNYNNYAPSKTGTGASGTWDISISGKAAGLSYYSIDNNLTVAQAKNQIRSKLTNKGIAAVVLGSSYIDQWNTNTASYYESSVHSMIALNPGYDNTTYGHFLVAHYGDRDLCHIGVDGNNWGRLRTLLDSANYTNYTVTKTGGGASGTWGINITGNASTATTATKLATARTINGTSFDGSANITTTNWGTARTLTIGNTGKSVNGSSNISWTLSEIGAAAAGHTHAAATTSANGFMSSSDKSKLDGIATGANKYSHPTYTSRASGLYKITVDGTGHVSAATAVAKSDITALGIPSTNTTYSVATTSSNGLMSSSDKTKLNKANINVYKMSNIDTVATGSSNYVDIGFCSGYNTSFGGTYICISISWQGYAIQFRMGQGASTVKTRCTNTSKQWTGWH